MRAVPAYKHQDYCGCVSPLQGNFRRNLLHAGGPLPSPPPRLLFSLGCGRLCGLGYMWYEGQVICVSNDIDCDHQAQRCGKFRVPQALWERYGPHLRAMEESLYGTTWYMISPLLTTDEAVRCRMVAKRWNVGSRCGKTGAMFFQLLHNDPFAKQWYYDSEGNKLCTLLKKRNPIM